ncbi:DUF3800 domain-containing protein [Pseudomonas aeruginosa]|nr:DUF3800 domain-containing protein [Pseudomonas aeruginosa]MDP5859435.1 DUF3800 domain-containing protein [Pseudomonas aeruginosa]HBO5405256.1 DUF3800 domain-containing protein [Pseudomonas aeruginosa]HCF0753801.1 DUF3800 domain-containing protein [Pseudomonas aeruginosa]HCL3401332.1 DUF3800 domain-containing protein [Pseudomonas aeruginosa]
MANSDWLVFVDESGDHSLDSIDQAYPVFALTFCLIHKDEYLDRLVPRIKRLKCNLFGHDKVVFHEAEIVRRKGVFRFMGQVEREQLLEQLTLIIQEMNFHIYAMVIDKVRHKARYVQPEHPYHLAMKFGLERIYRHLNDLGQAETTTYFIFEARGYKEDAELELAFRRVCDGENWVGQTFPFQIVIADKKTNCEGLQLADLTARPIGLSHLRPDQPNRAYDVLRQKIGRYGRKVFP